MRWKKPCKGGRESLRSMLIYRNQESQEYQNTSQNKLVLFWELREHGGGPLCVDKPDTRMPKC